jgi:ABC-type phosphate/phosphonate transport system substrate-binding protein
VRDAGLPQMGRELSIQCVRMLSARPLRGVGLMIACLVVLVLPPTLASAAADETTPGYRFGVFPYVPALTIDRIFGPIAASFATELDRPVYLKTRSTFESFAEQVEQQVYDIIFVHPFLYVDAADRHDYLPLVRLEGELTAVALVRKERPWRTWSDLAGKVVATPPALAAVSELTRWALLDAGLVPQVDTTLRPYENKMGCLQAVSVGAADACVLPRFVLPQIGQIGGSGLRVMAESPAIPHLLFATHPRLPRTERMRLLALILSWPDTEQGRAILAAGAWPGFVAAQDADYAQVRSFGARLRMHAER